MAGRVHLVLPPVRLTDGRTLEADVKAARGTADNPLTREEFEAKFRRLAGVVLPAERVERIQEMLTDLPKLRDLAPLAALAGGR